jgi:hypothetical protein
MSDSISIYIPLQSKNTTHNNLSELKDSNKSENVFELNEEFRNIGKFNSHDDVIVLKSNDIIKKKVSLITLVCCPVFC